MYLYAIIDVYSRFTVGWRLSNTLSVNNCYELVEDCIKRYGAPEIINSDQGSQYTTKQWEDLLTGHGIQISMDGKGRCKYNIWIEHFWRTIKQEYIYLNPADSVDELRDRIWDCSLKKEVNIWKWNNNCLTLLWPKQKVLLTASQSKAERGLYLFLLVLNYILKLILNAV